MNLSADSGAILRMLMPFPLHNDLAPPSVSMVLKPVMIPRLLLRDPCTLTKKG